MSNWNLINGTALSPTTTTGTYGIRINASSTIGNGTGAGGLTINGGATTTGNAVFGGTIDLNLTQGLLTTNSTGLVSASTTIGDGIISDVLTVTGGTLGSNTIASGATWTTAGTLTLGDGGDAINVNSSTWDITSGAMTGLTNISVSGSSTRQPARRPGDDGTSSTSCRCRATSTSSSARSTEASAAKPSAARFAVRRGGCDSACWSEST